MQAILQNYLKKMVVVTGFSLIALLFQFYSLKVACQIYILLAVVCIPYEELWCRYKANNGDKPERLNDKFY